MTKFRADLHCHTSCSDGTVSPEAIIQLACNSDLQGLSITDHDTIEAYQTALPIAQMKNLPLISGIEFSAVHQQTSVHILAYSFALKSSHIQTLCRRHYERRQHRNQKILDLLATHGMPLTIQDFPEDFLTRDSKCPIGRPHIAVAMMHKGYVNSINQAFHEYIGEGKPCYAQGEIISVEETLSIIHQASGLAIIAHPHLIENPVIVQELLKMNFDGIEGYYARFPHTEQERWVKIGMRKNWLITGGSDFHGAIKPQIPLGSSWVNEETFNILNQRFQQNQLSPA